VFLRGLYREISETWLTLDADLAVRVPVEGVVRTSVVLFVVVFGCRSHGHASRASRGVVPAASSSAHGPPLGRGPSPPAPSPKTLPYTLPLDADFNGLPVIAPAECGAGGARTFVPLPRQRWIAVLDAAAGAWPVGLYMPRECVRTVRARCAPDLDGRPGPETLIEIAYRVPIDGVIATAQPFYPSCSSKERSDETVIVAMSSPVAPASAWTFSGIVGFARHGTGEGGLDLTILSFVRLPNGTTGVHAHAVQPGFSMRYDLVLAPGDTPEWRNVGVRELNTASRPSP